MSTPVSPLSPDGASLHHPALYAEVVDQLSRTMQHLLLDALARARQLPDAGLPAAPRRTPAPRRPVARPALPPPSGATPMPLSERECEVLQRIAAGDSNKMIARVLDLSPHTVKRHVANILDKLDLRSRGQAAAWWMAQPPQRPLGH